MPPRCLTCTATFLFSILLHSPATAQQPASAADSRAAKTAAELPALAQLHDGWNTIAPDDSTTCARGAEYRFFVRPASVDRLLVFFSGGGACWTGENCDPDAKPTYESQAPGAGPSEGIFAFDNPENPVAGYSMVFVSYCTGDTHLGDVDTTYNYSDNRGAHTIRIHHRGQRNVEAVLHWVYANYPAPRQVIVSGSSAGGVATPFYASLIARHYPEASVVALGDAASAYTREGMAGADQERWGIPDVIRRWPGWEGYEKGGVPGLYIDAARAASRVRFYQVDAAYDYVQRAYLELAGTKDPDVAAFIRQDHQRIRAAVPSFRSFLVGGEIHTVMGDPVFYAYVSDGHRFRDWFAALVAGDTVPNVDCGACRRPDLTYSPQDLTIIDRAIARLSRPGVWNPHEDPDPSRPCPAGAARVGVVCALVDAGREVGAEMPGKTMALLDALYTASVRLDLPLRERPLATFNSRAGTTLQDVLGILGEVRSRIEAQVR